MILVHVYVYDYINMLFGAARGHTMCLIVWSQLQTSRQYPDVTLCW